MRHTFVSTGLLQRNPARKMEMVFLPELDSLLWFYGITNPHSCSVNFLVHERFWMSVLGTVMVAQWTGDRENL